MRRFRAARLSRPSFSAWMLRPSPAPASAATDPEISCPQFPLVDRSPFDSGPEIRTVILTQPVRDIRALKLLLDGPEAGIVLFRHLFGERAFGGFQFRFQHDRPPVPCQRMQETGFGLFRRRIGPGKRIAPEGRSGLQTPGDFRQIPAQQVALERFPFKRRMEGGYIYDFIA